MATVAVDALDARNVQEQLMQLDMKMYGKHFLVENLLRDLNGPGPLQGQLANSFVNLVKSKFASAVQKVDQKLRAATKAAMLLGRDMQSRKSSIAAAKDEYLSTHYADIETSLEEVREMLTTFKPYTRGRPPYQWKQQPRPQTFLNNADSVNDPGDWANFQSFYPKFGAPQYLRDIGIQDFTQFQYFPALMQPLVNDDHELAAIHSVNGQAYLTAWMSVFAYLLANPGANGANWNANVANVDTVWDAMKANTGVPPLGQVATTQLVDPPCPGGEQTSVFKSYGSFANLSDMTFAKMLQVVYAAFNQVPATTAVDFGVAAQWVRQVVEEGRQLRFTSPAEDRGLDMIMQRPELEAKTLTLLSDDQLRAMFIRDRLKNLKEDLAALLPPRNCQSAPLASSHSRYSIETVLVQLVEGVARSPDLYSNSHINFILMGDAGAGKTFYARLIGKVLKGCGLLISEKDIDIISKSDLVGTALGQTAPKTKARLVRDLQNVMFIDEAYSLTQLEKSATNGKAPTWEQYGFEAVGEIINFLDKNKGNICVIAAGYEKEMREKFLKINEGMPRRFPFQIVLPNYSPEELAALFCTFLKKTFGVSNRVSANAEQFLIGVIQQDSARLKPVLFPNSAGDIENLANFASTAAAGAGDYSEEDIRNALDNYGLMTRNKRYEELLALPDSDGVQGAADAEMAADADSDEGIVLGGGAYGSYSALRNAAYFGVLRL